MKMYNIEEIKNTIICGDCLEELKKFPDNSIDAIVTDPPAGISFMNKEWDDKGNLFAFQDFIYRVFSEAIRVLKPGGHCLVWALPRTSHHTAMGIERAGFEIRDKIFHIFGSGFPKSLNVANQIAKREGAKREGAGTLGNTFPLKKTYQEYIQTKNSKKWEGWGTGLKPATEEWILARKPISEKTIAENVLKWGTGGLNIDGCRIGTEKISIHGYKGQGIYGVGGKASYTTKENGGETKPTYTEQLGRFPSNLTHDGSEEVMKLFPETKPSKSGGKGKALLLGEGIKNDNTIQERSGYDDNGGSAARFFYCAKASKSERNMGLEKSTNNHPTVKSIKLMRYLCRLITPPGGIVLDMFAGSASTLIAAKQEGFNYIGIEKEEEYVKIAEARLKAVNNHLI